MKKVIFSLIALMTAKVMNGQVKQTYLTLNNGVQMPQFGLGVYSIPDGDETYNSVMTALKCGYRHIDTAHAYQNERSVGRAVKDSVIDRSEIWITSKLWPNEYGEGKTLKAIDRMCGRLVLTILTSCISISLLATSLEAGKKWKRRYKAERFVPSAFRIST